MSATTLYNDIPAAVHVHGTQAIASAKRHFDASLVRFDAWFLVFTAVILALGATLLLGMAVYCVIKQGGKRFTGGWSFANGGIHVNFECI